MTKLRLSSLLVLGTIFAVSIISYGFFQPFIPGAVCEALPAQTSFVFRANNLNELLQSPVCGQLDKALGVDNSLKEMLAANTWTKWAVASELAVADIPFRNAGEQKTWAAVTWVGWRSPWLRWKLENSRNKNLNQQGKHLVWPIWTYDAPDLAPGMSLTFALTDNLFITCLSENPTDIQFLLDTYDKRAPSVQK